MQERNHLCFVPRSRNIRGVFYIRPIPFYSIMQKLFITRWPSLKPCAYTKRHCYILNLSSLDEVSQLLQASLWYGFNFYSWSNFSCQFLLRHIARHFTFDSAQCAALKIVITEFLNYLWNLCNFVSYSLIKYPLSVVTFKN